MAQLSWSSARQPKEIVPKERLFPPAGFSAPKSLLPDGEGGEIPANDGSDGGACGATGAEVLLLLGLIARRRRNP